MRVAYELCNGGFTLKQLKGNEQSSYLNIGHPSPLLWMVPLIILFIATIFLTLSLVGSGEADLELHFPMDEGSGDTVFDQSTRGNDGTLNGPVWGSGISEYAPIFDGNDDYIGVPHSSSTSPTKEVTISAWFTVQDKTKTQSIISKTESGGYGITIVDDGYLKLIIHIAGNYRIAQCSISDFENDEWNSVVGTFNGEEVDLYLNGDLKDSIAIS